MVTVHVLVFWVGRTAIKYEGHYTSRRRLVSLYDATLKGEKLNCFSVWDEEERFFPF